MARKNAAMLKSTPVKISALGRELLARLGKIKPVPGCEEQWERYVATVKAQEEASARYDMIYKQVEREGGDSSCPSWPAFMQAGHEYDIKVKSCFGALDAYTYAAKHVDDPVPTDESNVREVIAASLEGNLDGLDFSLKSTGLVAAKIAHAIIGDVIEEETGAFTLCEDCAA